MCYTNGKNAPRRTFRPQKDSGRKLGGARAVHGMSGRVGGRAMDGQLGHGDEIFAVVWRKGGGGPSAAAPGLKSLGCHMTILRVANTPVSERARCFIDNDDLGQLGCASTLLYATVSIALTLWAVWDPSVPGGGQWVGSPMAFRRPFLADGSSSDVVD